MSKPNNNSLSHAERAARRKQAAEHAAKHGTPAAAQEFSMSYCTIKQACREFGIIPQDHWQHSRPATRTLEIVRRLLDGETQTSIAQRFGLSRQAVSGIKKQAAAVGFKL